jgi:hypothetical protein
MPERGPAAGGTPLRILGAGLRPPQSISVAGITVPSWHVVSDAELQMTTPPGPPDAVDIVVTVNGVPSTGPARRFTYVPAPVIHFAEVRKDGSIDVFGDNLTPVRGVLVGHAAPVSVRQHDGGLRIKPPPGPRGDVALTVLTDGGTSEPYKVSLPTGWTRPFVFWLAVTYMAMLAALALSYKLIPTFSGHFPDPWGPLPLSIPWFGALGAVALSLSGVIYHTVERDWDSNYLLWHVARPILGAVFATIAYFILAGGVLASGGNPNAATSPAAASGAGTSGTSGAVQNLFYIVLAFVIGYREETFRTLIQRVGDVILGPSDKGSTAGGAQSGATPARPATATTAAPAAPGSAAPPAPPATPTTPR